MPRYAPGSFTKNFGWNLSPPGLSKLHTVIKAGFGGTARRVSRDDFRRHCGLPDSNIQLIPINFFLHNTVVSGANYVTADEPVRNAINNPHSRRFDKLALFSMHLSRMGRRIGVAGDPKGAAFTNDFVRIRLWNKGGWETARLTEAEVEAAFSTTVEARGSDTVHKCVTNYLYMLEMVGLRAQRTSFINIHIDEWIGPGLFVAFDRHALDRTAAPPLSKAELLSRVRVDELHKLMGITQAYMDSVSPLIADEYLDLGGLARVTGPAIQGVEVISSPTYPATSSDAAGVPSWSDEDAQDMAMILRRIHEVQAQIRSAQHVRELKALYQNACNFCGKKTVIGVDPSKALLGSCPHQTDWPAAQRP
jgi:hypothetical protein